MQFRSALMVKASRSTAAVYATHELTTESVLRAVAWVNGLPDSVRAVCVDLRRARVIDPVAARALELGLAVWRVLRHGMTSVLLPDRAEARLLAVGR